MRLPHLPRPHPDKLTAAGLLFGLPALVLILEGAPVVETALFAAILSAILILIN